MTRHRLDGGDDFVVADFLAGADERGVAAIHEDAEVVLGVAAQGVDEFLAFFGGHGSEIHAGFSFRVRMANGRASAVHAVRRAVASPAPRGSRTPRAPGAARADQWRSTRHSAPNNTAPRCLLARGEDHFVA